MRTEQSAAVRHHTEPEDKAEMEARGAQRYITVFESLNPIELENSTALGFFFPPNLWEPINLPFCLNHFELFF